MRKRTAILGMLIITSLFLLAGCNRNNAAPETTIATSAQVKEFTMTAKQWDFQPSTISVNQGDTVKLHINSIDVKHGFGLPTFNVQEELEPGKTIDIEFVADKKGTFSFFCTVQCGLGHGGMRGQLIVR